MTDDIVKYPVSNNNDRNKIKKVGISIRHLMFVPLVSALF